jgi:hypothetical protein
MYGYHQVEDIGSVLFQELTQEHATMSHHPKALMRQTAQMR